MLSEKTQQKILKKFPPHSYLKKFLELLFMAKNFSFRLKENLFLFIFKTRNFFFPKPVRGKIKDINFRLIPWGACAFGVWKDNAAHDRAEIEFILNNLKPSSILFDIGANVGLFSIVAGLKEKTCKIYAFEPSSQNFEILKENTKLNNLKNVFPDRVAIANFVGETMLKLNSSFKDVLNTIGQPRYPDCKIVGKEKVPVTTLDEFIKRNNIPKVNIMKVDVEGAEFLVFQGAKTLLKRKDAPLIIYESSLWTTKGFGYHPVEIMWSLRDLGYKLFDLDEETGKISPFLSARQYDATIIALKPNHPLFKGLILKDKTG